MPTSLNHASEIDSEDKRTFWIDTIAKEMKSIVVAFETLETRQVATVACKITIVRIRFDAKMNFTRKTRWVLDGNRNPVPKGSTCARVVSRESTMPCFTCAALNDVDVWAYCIQNTYLQAPTTKKCYIICVQEFSLDNVGKVAIIHRSVHGRNSDSRDFRNHLRSHMQHLSFMECLAYPDFWMRPAMKSNGQECYEKALRGEERVCMPTY